MWDWKLSVRMLVAFLSCWGCFSFTQGHANQGIAQYFISVEHSQRPTLFAKPLYFPEQLKAFYQQRGFRVAWYPPVRQDNGQQLLIDFIGNLPSQGLSPNDYHHKILLQHCQWPLQAEAHLPCDILLSDAFLLLSQHLQIGKVDPNQLFDKSLVAKEQPIPRLTQALTVGNLAQYLQHISPQTPQYQSLKSELSFLQAKSVPEWQPLEAKPSIRLEESDQRLLIISERLHYWGDLAEPSYQLEYGAVLEQAVRHFQARHGLEADGIIGKATVAALNISPKIRIEQLKVNLERLRWAKHNLDERHVVVNIAAYQLQGFENGEVAFEQKVIVGKPKRQTPVFNEEIKYLTFNPTWTVPFKLATRDKLPILQKDPSYIQKMGFRVFENHSSPVNPANIDWHALSKHYFPYQLVQSPGPENALGQVKFMFPNKFEVYLHDTPAKSLFKKARRAFSSGCIRLSEPLKLAEWVLQTEGLGQDDIKKLLYKKRTDTVYLSDSLPVHIEYRTAFVDDKQVLNFREDIYQRDQKVYQALQNSQQAR